MIKMKKILEEGSPGFDNRQFGDSLPTLKSIADNHQQDETIDEETIVESNIKVLKSTDVDSKIWRNMKYDLRDQFDELVKIGEDYGVFQNAQGTHKLLKQIKRLMDKI